MNRIAALTAAFPALRRRLEQLADGWRGVRGEAAPQDGRVPSHALRPLQTEWLDTAPGLQVTCLDGCLVLNVEGREEDIILVRGESHACDSEGRIALQALVATDVLVH